MTTWINLKTARHQVAIAGMVADAETGAAIGGAEVHITHAPERFTRWLALNAMQHGEKWVTLRHRPDRTHTATQGHFSFLDLPDGDYSLTVSLPNSGTRYDRAIVQNITVSRDTEGTIRHHIVEIALPTTALKGQISTGDEPIAMAKIQVEGSPTLAFSDRAGQYLLTQLEVWQPPLDSPRPIVTVSAVGYQTVATGVQLSQGQVQTLDFNLKRN
ncbi:carboxypeptidase regulatory-like domain-containing protein [Myxacorys almedinensis]|uniref:Carboxypeptidase regulatory-like domain-containing protein n=1 Tax=Myxacorys almedinensis A TaxID=2690445 RepID=A0A8J8CH97_9CYAN|nr:carboxypeptidase regulatory-like domain-containing protein [Myxacorys almedinensis]NDJ16473.1 hypothetical protein [Myxacorys almedinensis A]